MHSIHLSFYGILSLSALSMISCINPINAALFLISIFFSTSVIFILLNVDFLGLLFLMVYVGAIAVLFLFIVMMLNLKRVDKDNTTYLIVGISATLLLLIQFAYVLFSNSLVYIPYNLTTNHNLFSFIHSNPIDEATRVVNIKKLGILIYSEFPVLLFVCGLTLLVAMIGAIFLTNEKKGYSIRSQYHQLARENNVLSANIYRI